MCDIELVVDWREPDRQLRALAGRRAEADAQEARWIREAERLGTWRELGHATILAYLEAVLGYAPRTAADRLRVARALDELPQLAAELGAGRLHYTVARELARVASPATEAARIDRARGKNVREVQELVSGHRKGSRPTDAPDDDLRVREVSFELVPDVFALLRETRLQIEREIGERLDDNALIEALCRRALETTTPASAPTQIAITRCRDCQRSWQHGAGAPIEIDEAAAERAACDAQHLGATDAAVPARATQDVTPATRRLVLHRDHGRCTVPGCRSARGLDLHHIVPRSEGGSHEPSNISVLCSAHHRQLHNGVLSITGRAPDALTFARVHARAEPPSPVVDLGLVREALRELGIRGTSADAAIRAACSSGATTVEAVVRFALRQIGSPATVFDFRTPNTGTS